MAERRMDMVPGDEPHVSTIMQRLRGYSKGPAGAQEFAIACLDEMFPRVESPAEVIGLPPGTILGRLGGKWLAERRDHSWDYIEDLENGGVLQDLNYGMREYAGNLDYPLRVLRKGSECDALEQCDYCSACRDYETPSW